MTASAQRSLGWRRASVRALVSLAVLAVAAAAAPSRSLAQEQIETRAGLHPFYGRVVFDWGRIVGYEAAIEGDDAVIRFDAPMRSDLTAVPSVLDAYVDSARLEEGGRVVRLGLSQPATLSSFRSGNSIAIDLRRLAGTEGANADSGDPTEAPPVVVRVGLHPDYTRLVYDFDEAPTFSANEDAGVVTVRFERPARFEAAQIAASLPAPFGSPTVERDGPATIMRITVPEGTSVRSFLSGPRVVVDLASGPAPAPPEAEDAPVSPPEASGIAVTDPSPEPAVEEPETVDAAPTASTEAEASDPPASNGGPTPLAPDAVAVLEAEAAAAAERILEQEEEAAAAAEDSAAAPEGGSNADEPAVEAGLDAAQSVDVVGTRARQPEADIGPQTEEDLATQEALESGVVSFLRDSSGRPVQPEGPAPVSFSFDWPEEVGAAVYERGGFIWVVFDRRAPIDLAPLRRQGAPLIDRIEQLPISGATVVRMRAQPNVHPVVTLEGFNWVVDFRLEPYAPRIQAEIQAEADADTGPRLLFPSANPGGLVTIPDPEIGDSIQVATYRDPGVGVANVRTYPEFRLLSTAQGVAVEPFGDNVVFERSFEGFAISSTEGLHISAVSPEAPVSTGQTLSARRLFNVQDWVAGGPGTFDRRERRLMATVAEVPEDNKNDARLDLLRFYLARGRGPEATGVMRVIENDDENLFKESAYRALRGATHVLNRDFEAARQDLNDPRLDAFAEAALWRGALLAELGDWTQAATQFQAGDSILRNYPYPLKGRLGLLRAEAALATRDLQTARSWLDELERDSDLLTRGERGDLRYHQGRIALTRNDLDLARELWNELIDSDDRKNAARAEYALVNMERRQGTLTDDDVVERLEKLRFRWRGDRFELAVLRRLGEIYMDKQDYFEGFQTFRLAVSYFSEDPLAEQLAREMTDLFRDLYIEGGADEMPPLRALALYDEFRELTPSGPDGDLLIEKLADRLVDVDLLGRASALLDHQAEFRLQGEERARIGAKLAFIRLLDNDPIGAVDALNKTAFPQLDNRLEDDRRRLRAKAMFEMDRDDEAVKLLAGDTSMASDILRQDIYRKLENWTEAARVLQRLSGDPPDLNDEIEEDRARHVVNWAVALKLDRDEDGLEQLRELYGPAMNLSPFRDVFNYIVQPPDEGGASLQASIEQLASSDGFGAFLENYRDQLLSPVLSEERDGPITSGVNNLEG